MESPVGSCPVCLMSRVYDHLKHQENTNYTVVLKKEAIEKQKYERNEPERHKRYLEIVKELRHLPDMGKAFIAASSL